MSGKHRLVERAEDALRRKGFLGASVQDSTEETDAPKGSIQAPDSYPHPRGEGTSSSFWAVR